MSDFVYHKYRGYEVIEANDEDMPRGGVFIMTNATGFQYLDRNGEVQNNCSDGWYDSVEEAKHLINKVTSAIQIGGE